MKLLAVDGTNVAMRYAHAMVPLIRDPGYEVTPADENTVALAVEACLRNCARATDATGVAVGFDSAGRTWRAERFPAYKATRAGTKSHPWSKCVRDHLDEQGWLVLQAEGFEADDVVATLAARAAVRRIPLAVLSGDSDLLQLSDDACETWQFGSRGEPRFCHRDPYWIVQKYGLRALGQLGLYKALVGEPGDNLPGVEGIGPVKAKRLLDQFWTAGELIAAGVLSVPHRKQLEFALELVQLRTDVPLPPRLSTELCRIPAVTYTDF